MKFVLNVKILVRFGNECKQFFIEIRNLKLPETTSVYLFLSLFLSFSLFRDDFWMDEERYV